MSVGEAGVLEKVVCISGEEESNDLLYKYLLAFLMWVSPLKYKWIGNVHSHTQPSPRQGSFMNPSLTGEFAHVLTSPVLFSGVSSVSFMELL